MNEASQIDESILKDLMMLNTESDPTFLADLLDRFEVLAVEKIDQINAALDQNDRESVFKLAHSLKGSAANLGAAGIAEICQTVQNECRTADEAAIRGLTQKLTTTLPDSLSELRRFIQTP